jgi:hypothetical protein
MLVPPGRREALFAPAPGPGRAFEEGPKGATEYVPTWRFDGDAGRQVGRIALWQ